jgi:hypothetical protein
VSLTDFIEYLIAHDASRSLALSLVETGRVAGRDFGAEGDRALCEPVLARSA